MFRAVTFSDLFVNRAKRELNHESIVAVQKKAKKLNKKVIEKNKEPVVGGVQQATPSLTLSLLQWRENLKFKKS